MSSVLERWALDEDDDYVIEKGDYDGHPFRGNQYTTADRAEFDPGDGVITLGDGTPVKMPTKAMYGDDIPIRVPIEQLDALTAGARNAIGPNGEGEIGDRRARARKWIEENHVLEAPRVGPTWYGEGLEFGDGRHRTKALLDLGAKEIIVDVPRRDLKRVLALLRQGVTKGDLPGHDFRGNQYTGGIPAELSHVPDVVARAIEEQPSRARHGIIGGSTKDTMFYVQPDGSVLTWGHGDEVRGGVRVHSHSGESTSVPDEDQTFDTFSPDDVKQFLRRAKEGRLVADAVITADGRMHVLAVGPDTNPAVYGVSEKRLTGMLNPGNAARTKAFNERGLKAHEFHEELLRRFADANGLRYITNARWKPAPVKKGDYEGHPFRGNQYTGGIDNNGAADGPVRTKRRGWGEARYTPRFHAPSAWAYSDWKDLCKTDAERVEKGIPPEVEKERAAARRESGGLSTFSVGDYMRNVFGPDHLPAPEGVVRTKTEARQGRCYELAAKFALDNEGWKVTHATLYPRAGDYADSVYFHAFAEKDGVVYDGVFDQFYSRDDYYKFYDITDARSFDADKARVQMLRTKHWGAWDAS